MKIRHCQTKIKIFNQQTNIKKKKRPKESPTKRKTIPDEIEDIQEGMKSNRKGQNVYKTIMITLSI